MRRRIKVDRDVVPVKLRESAGGRDGYQQDCRNPDEEDHTDLVIMLPVTAEAKTFSLSDNTSITAFLPQKETGDPGNLPVLVIAGVIVPVIAGGAG